MGCLKRSRAGAVCHIHWNGQIWWPFLLANSKALGRKASTTASDNGLTAMRKGWVLGVAAVVVAAADPLSAQPASETAGRVTALQSHNPIQVGVNGTGLGSDKSCLQANTPLQPVRPFNVERTYPPFWIVREVEGAIALTVLVDGAGIVSGVHIDSITLQIPPPKSAAASPTTPAEAGTASSDLTGQDPALWVFTETDYKAMGIASVLAEVGRMRFSPMLSGCEGVARFYTMRAVFVLN
jgi:hypothetical protein